MNKKHRIFIAINLPPEIKKDFSNYEKRFSSLPAKWTPRDNLHVTLLFIGDVTETELGEVCLAAKEVAERHEALEINLNKVDYGPDEKIPPRYLWVSGQKTKELVDLKNDLQNAIEGKVNVKIDGKFALHVTLARINTMEWRGIEPEERPEVNENVDLSFSVESIEVMESVLKKSGPEYTVIESFELGQLF